MMSISELIRYKMDGKVFKRDRDIFQRFVTSTVTVLSYLHIK